MARPLRIEFEGAWYHVMNRGAGQREIFASDEQRQGFLDLLGDARERFGVETHAFCLMGNHYHLLLHTPQANLSRAMRHIDGVYTQRYNRAVGSDGPLFRGRFRSIVVDADAYLLAVSRYIHRNPAAAGLVAEPIDYPWSSYPAYVGRAAAPPWLERDVVWSALGARSPARAYRRFVDRPEATEVDAFHERGDGGAILGSDHFRDTVLAGFTGSEREFPDLRRRRTEPVAAEAIVERVAAVFGVPMEEVTGAGRTRRGGASSHARMQAMHLCQTLGGMPLEAIRQTFGLGHYGSVSAALARYRALKTELDHLAALEQQVRNTLLNEQT